MESQQNESRIKACKVCFTPYDMKDRRPRVLFCGHTFCSRCVTDNFKEKKVVCPTCRKEHQAICSSDFPVNYELECVLQEDPTSGQLGSEDNSIPFCDVSRDLSKKLRSIRQELSSDIEGLRTKGLEACSQLHQYKSQLMEWKEQHHKNLKVYRVIVHQHEDVITCIHKECLRVDEAIGMGNEETQMMKIAGDNLALASTSNEVMPAFEEANLCYDVLDTWTQTVHKHFPDNKLITQSKKLTERSKSGLLKFSVSLDKEESVPTASASQCQDMTSPTEENEVSQDDMAKEKGLAVSLEIEEKIQKTLDCIPTDQINQCVQTETHTSAALDVQDRVNMTPLAKNLLDKKQVYAVKDWKRKEEQDIYYLIGASPSRNYRLPLRFQRLHSTLDPRKIPTPGIKECRNAPTTTSAVLSYAATVIESAEKDLLAELNTFFIYCKKENCISKDALEVCEKIWELGTIIHHFKHVENMTTYTLDNIITEMSLKACKVLHISPDEYVGNLSLSPSGPLVVSGSEIVRTMASFYKGAKKCNNNNSEPISRSITEWAYCHGCNEEHKMKRYETTGMKMYIPSIETITLKCVQCRCPGESHGASLVKSPLSLGNILKHTQSCLRKALNQYWFPGFPVEEKIFLEFLNQHFHFEYQEFIIDLIGVPK